LKESGLTIAAANPELGNAEADVEIELSVEPSTIGFNINHFSDVLSAMKSERISMTYGKGTVCHFSGDEDPSFISLLVSVSLIDDRLHPQAQEAQD
jgi:DNA polymerase III sliding clamp (beta) subunit (PCNA family)